jgi:hypothetical protein
MSARRRQHDARLSQLDVQAPLRPAGAWASGAFAAELVELHRDLVVVSATL